MDETPLQLNDEILLTVLPFGNEICNDQVSVQILNASIHYIIDLDRFTGSLIEASFFFSFSNFNTPKNRNGYAHN